MSETTRHGISKISEICQLRIESLLQLNTVANGAVVSTRDGFEVAKSLHSSVSPAKIAAMSGSLLSVADAITRLGEGAVCKNVVIESDSGQVVIMSIPTIHTSLLMTVFCVANMNLGQVLGPIRRCVQDIGSSLDMHRESASQNATSV
jgi:predicted regulator of Ras-like GTPase activity (Roadblock/LC7/MglB family)